MPTYLSGTCIYIYIFTSGETGSERLRNLLTVTQQRKTAGLPKGKGKPCVTEQGSGQGAVRQGAGE